MFEAARSGTTEGPADRMVTATAPVPATATAPVPATATAPVPATATAPLADAGAAGRASSARRVLLDRVAAMSDDELAHESSRIAAAVSAAQAELAVVLREIERRDLHHDWECQSIERFAGWKCQIAPARASALSALGRAIEVLPALGAAVVDGELAIDKAVPIARVASRESVDALVELARHATVDQTRRFCSKWRRVGGESAAITGLLDDGPEEHGTTDDVASARALDDAALGRLLVIHDDDGVEMRARFDHVHGALVLTAIDAVAAQVRAERREAVPADATTERSVATSGARPSSVDEIPLERLDRGQWRAQAVLRMCEIATHHVPTTVHRSGFSAEVVVHVPVGALLDPADVDPRSPSSPPSSTPVAVATLEPRGIGLQAEAARLLVCDSGLHAVVEADDGDPLHLGRRRTSITAAQRRAVHARDPHCRWPGCTAMTVQLHHRHHRVAGGHDDIENLVPLCTWHHGVVHRRSIVVGRSPDGELRFVRSDGTTVGACARAADHERGDPPPPIHPGSTVDALRARQRELGIAVDSPLRAPQWTNDRFDLSDVIAAIADRRDAALRRTVPTGPTRSTTVPTGPTRSTRAQTQTQTQTGFSATPASGAD